MEFATQRSYNQQDSSLLKKKRREFPAFKKRCISDCPLNLIYDVFKICVFAKFQEFQVFFGFCLEAGIPANGFA